MLEEGSFRGRTADFVFMFLFGAFVMTVSFKYARLVALPDDPVIAIFFQLDSSISSEQEIQ